MPRKKNALDPDTRDRVIARARTQIDLKKQRHTHGAAMRKVATAASALWCGLGEVETQNGAAAWLEQHLHSSPIKTLTEWKRLLTCLMEAVMNAMPHDPPKRGTYYHVGIDGKRIGPVLNIGGGKADPRGRKTARPMLEMLVIQLLDETDGNLTFDKKNGGTGSLADALKDMRRELPDIIPAAPAASTIASMVANWRRRQNTGQKNHA